METGIHLINFKQRLSGSMIGYADLAMGGMTITGVKVFLKPATMQAWISPPAEKIEGHGGEVSYRDIVEMTKSMQRHLSSMVHDEILALAGLPPRTVGEDVGRKMEQAKQAPLPTPAEMVKPPFTRQPRPRAEAHEKAYNESRAASQNPLVADIPY